MFLIKASSAITILLIGFFPIRYISAMLLRFRIRQITKFTSLRIRRLNQGSRQALQVKSRVCASSSRESTLDQALSGCPACSQRGWFMRPTSRTTHEHIVHRCLFDACLVRRTLLHESYNQRSVVSNLRGFTVNSARAPVKEWLPLGKAHHLSADCARYNRSILTCMFREFSRRQNRSLYWHQQNRWLQRAILAS